MFREDLPHYTAYIAQNETFLGCGVMYKFDSGLFVITAGHNCYGKNFDQECDISGLRVHTEDSCSYLVSEIIGTAEEVKPYDLVLLKLVFGEKSLDNYSHEPPTLKEAHFSDGAYIKRVNIKFGDNPWNVFPMHYDEPDSDGMFYVDVDSKFLYGNNGTFGPAALGGISGSGVFLESKFSDNPRILVGIVVEVRKSTLANKIKCSCIGNVRKLVPGIVVNDATAFKANIVDAVDKMLDDISDRHSDEAIKEWMTNNEQTDEVAHLIRKTKLVYPDRRIELERIRIVRNLLNGKVIFKERVMKEEVVRTLYNKVIGAFKGKSDTFFYSKGPADANPHWNLLNSVLLSLLDESLRGKLSAVDIELLGNYTFSDFITNCTIDLEPVYDSSQSN